MPEPQTIASGHQSDILDRIRRGTIVLGVCGIIPASIFWGWRAGLGFAVGGAVGYVNFYWLEKGVAGMVQLTVKTGVPASGRGVVVRFLLRYFLMGIIAFVILTVSRESLYGLFAGLLLPVAAILCEAVYQLYNVVSRQ